MQQGEVPSIRVWELANGEDGCQAGGPRIIEIALAEGSRGFGDVLEGTFSLETLAAVGRSLAGIGGLRLGSTERGFANQPGLVPPDLRFALNVALVDARARALARPLWELLGGRARSKIPFALEIGGALEDLDRAKFGGEAMPRRLLVRMDEASSEEALASLARLAEGARGRTAVAVDLGGGFSPQALQRLRPKLDVLAPTLIVDPGRDLDETLALGRGGRMGAPVAVCRPLSGPRMLGRALLLEGASAVVLDAHQWGGLRQIVDALAVCRAFSVKALLRARGRGPTCNALLNVCAADPWAVSSAVLPLSALRALGLRTSEEHVTVEDADGHGFDPRKEPGARITETIRLEAPA